MKNLTWSGHRCFVANLLNYLGADSSPVVFIQERYSRERWVLRKGAQGEMGREKMKVKTTGDESDLGTFRVNDS